MGLLTEGSPLSWEKTKELAEHVREHGITQFINLYHRLKDRQGDVLKWGDETEVKVERLVDNVIAESRRPFSWCIALLYFRVLPLHFSKHKNSTKTNIYQTKLLLKKHSKLVFILDHIPPPKMRVPPAISAGQQHLRCCPALMSTTSLEIVPISKISNSRGANQKYKLNCNGKAMMYRANHVMPRGLP
ncbi:hypothetical protein J6590_042678 [Homalodisca vitripennis]|nr:hypothetical protein J6590_042678 [Homalodisca vitripennis]